MRYYGIRNQSITCHCADELSEGCFIHPTRQNVPCLLYIHHTALPVPASGYRFRRLHQALTRIWGTPYPRTSTKTSFPLRTRRDNPDQRLIASKTPAMKRNSPQGSPLCESSRAVAVTVYLFVALAFKRNREMSHFK